jgi:O-antigen/teichoic acid export membrane protein/O-antigen ligase
LLTSPKRPQAPARGSALPALRFRLRLSLEGIRLRTIAGTVGARIAASFLGFGAGVIAARELGTHGRAQLALLIALPAIFSVVGVLGLDNANARFAGRSHSAFRQIIRRSVTFSAAAGTAMAAAWWFAGSMWPAVRLGLDGRLALMSAALCPVSLLLTLLGTAEIGRGRVAVYNLVMTVTSVAYFAGVVLLLILGQVTVVGCFAACAASQLLGAVLLLMLATTKVHPDGERVALRRYSSYAFRVYLPNLAQYGMLRMDVPIIQILAGTTAVALYAVALPIAEGVMLLPTAVALVIFPRVTSGAVDRAAADRIGHAVVAITALLAGAVALAAPVVIPAVYGAPYRGAVVVVWCMLPGLVLFSAGRTPQAYLTASDKIRLVIVATVAGVMAGLAGLAALTPRFGAAGAGASDSLGYLAFTVVVLGGIRRRKDPAHRLLQRSLRSCRGLSRRAADAVAVRQGSIRSAGFCCLAVATGLAAGLVATQGWPTLAATLGIVIVLVIVAQPRTGLFVLAIACPVSQTSFGASLVTAKNLNVLLFACLVGCVAARRLILPKARTAAIGLTLVCYFLLSATLANGASGAGQNWRYVLMLGIPLLCLPLVAGANAATRHALVVFGFSAACLAVAETVKSHAALVASGDTSAAGSAVTAASHTGAVNHNAEGAIFVLALAVLLAWLSRTRHPLAKLAVAAAIVALVLGIAYSFSRSSYFGALAVIAVFAARRSARGLASAAVAVGLLVPLLPAAVAARLGTVWTSSGQDPSSALRLDLWSSALRMFDAHPLTGVGYLNFSSQLPSYYVNTGNYDSFIIQFSKLDFAHNIYLTVLAEAGLVGAVLVGSLIVIGWRRGWSAARSGDWAGEGAVLGFVGVGVCAAFGEVLLVPPILGAFLLVVLAADGRREAARDGVARATLPVAAT